MELVHLTVEAIEGIHEEVLAAHGGSAGLRDRGMLESAVGAVQASMFGKPLLTDPVEVAGAYLFYLCKNHPFIDGNKRAALGACLVFLELNGFLPDDALPSRQTDAWESMVLAVAAGEMEREELTEALRALLGL